MTQQPYTTQTGSPFWRAVGNFFKFLVRLFAVIVIGALVGAGLYYGVPWAYRSLVQPVQDNTTQIASLKQELAQKQARVGEELQTFQARIATLETERTQLQEDMTVQAQEMQTQAEALQAQAEALQAAEARVQDLEQQVTQVEQDLTSQQEAVAALGKAFEMEMDAAAGRDEDTRLQLGGLEGRLSLIQTAQDLLKVRLLLLEENPLVAQDTVLLAVEHLERAAAASPELADTLAPLQERIAALEGLIKADSFRVGPELESLWADVMELALPPVVLVEQVEEITLLSPLSPPTPPLPLPTPTAPAP